VIQRSLREIWRQYRRTELPWTPSPECRTIASQRPERHLLTVGIGQPYDEAARRLARQAAAAGWFDVVHVIDGRNDSIGAANVLAELDSVRREYAKGAGLWAWKPALLRRAMAQAPRNAHVYYIDAGCEISPLASARFNQLDALLAERSALLFQLPFLEDEWTKKSLLTRFPSARGTRQIQATWLGLRNDATGAKLVSRWDDCCRENDFTWLKDPLGPELTGTGHRHDQSILSCVVKEEFSQLAYNPWEDFFAPWMYHRNSEVLLAPVHALRTRDGGSALDPLVQASTLIACVRAHARHRMFLDLLRRVFKRMHHFIRDELILMRGWLSEAAAPRT
jgi:hypothetical protein